MAATSLIEQYQRDGFFFPLQVMDGAEASAYRAQLEDCEHRYQSDARLAKILRRYPNLVLPFVDEITRRREITDAVGQLLGPDLLVLDCPFFIKEANSTSFVSWHQDLHYWGLEGDQEVTVWVALSEASSASGCMRFVAGSHHRQVEHADTFAEDNLLTRGQELQVEVDESTAIDVALQAGQASLHHGRVFHASHPNRTSNRRIGLAIRYVPTTMTQTPGGEMAAMLVRGEDRHGHFHQCRRPSGLMLETDIEHWQSIAGARNSVMMNGKG
jgi:hypothetical protein